MPEAKTRKTLLFKEDDGSEPVKVWLDALKSKKRFLEHQKIVAQIVRAGQGNLGIIAFLREL